VIPDLMVINYDLLCLLLRCFCVLYSIARKHRTYKVHITVLYPFHCIVSFKLLEAYTKFFAFEKK